VWYGCSSSGYPSANEHWKASEAAGLKLPGYKTGALAFWYGGQWGHVAIGDLSHGSVYSSDYPKPLYVGHGSIAAVSTWLGPAYVFKGWYKPLYSC
jgi:hypothetical protein